MCATLSAQTILKGDMNDDNQVTIADVTSVVNVILGKAPQETINVGGTPYAIDNSMVVGTWYAPDGTHFTLNEDGTTDFPGGATYEFYPSQGRLLILNASGLAYRVLPLVKVTSVYLLAVNYLTEAFTYYTNSASLVTGLSMSETSLAMNSGTTAQLSVTATPTDAFNPIVTWSSSDESIATVDQNGMVTAIASGTVIIIVSAMDGSGVQATCQVTVSGAPDAHEFVDLGLPSGTLWATMNVGATSPEDYGDYFAWGETEGYKSGKSNFDWSTYKWCKGSETTMTKYCYNSSYGYNGFTDNKTELDPEDDAAYVNWGSGWHMPSKAQFSELMNSSYTTTEWTTQNGVNGRKITSKTNGNSIFLPAAGCRIDTSLYAAGSGGHYWSRTLSSDYPNSALGLDFNSSVVRMYDGYRYYGRSIRPVRHQ